jgi:tetratricopeptide (TPR) repeat protein
VFQSAGLTTTFLVNNTFIFVINLFIISFGGNLLASIIEKQLQEVEQLFIHGKSQDALKVIEEGLKREDLTKEEKLSFLNLKSEIKLFLGNCQEALELAEYVLKENTKLNNPIIKIDALLNKAHSLCFNAKINEAIETGEKAFELLSTIKHLSEQKLAERKAKLFLYQASWAMFVGSLEKSLELNKEALSFAEKSGNQRLISFCLIDFSSRLSDYDFDKSMELMKNSLAIATKLGNKSLIAYHYQYKAGIYISQRDFKQAIDSYKKAYTILKEIKSTFLLGVNHIGYIYRELFQLDKALEFFQEALKYEPLYRSLNLHDIGYIYYLKNEPEKAREYYMKSMELDDKMNITMLSAHIHYELILILLELRDVNQAKKHLEHMKQLNEKSDFKTTKLQYRFATILVLKASKDFSDWGQAAKLLEEFLKLDLVDPYFQFRQDALYALLEIRVKELQFTTTEDALEEVKKQAIRLEVEAKEKQLHWLLANVYRLQSQLALVELDLKKALELLDAAQEIADEIGVELLKKEIKQDREKIDKQLAMLQKFQEQQAPISETMKLASLETTVKDIKQETVLEERDKETGEIINYRKLFALKI